jgi:CheY-like chemotaxis protein
MDGQTFLTLLHDEGHAPSVVIASGADPDTRQEMERTAVRLGMRVLGFLSKPISLDALLAILSKHETRVGEMPTADPS